MQKQCDGCHSMPGDALQQKLKGTCGTCHTQERRKPAAFDRPRYFRFDKHPATDCQTCHVGSDDGSYTCYGGHEHSRSKIREERVKEGISDYENRVACHRMSRARVRAAGQSSPSLRTRHVNPVWLGRSRLGS